MSEPAKILAPDEVGSLLGKTASRGATEADKMRHGDRLLDHDQALRELVKELTQCLDAWSTSPGTARGPATPDLLARAASVTT